MANSPPLKLTLERCTDCGARLGEPVEVRRRTITELPPPQPRIFDVEIARYNCPGCHRASGGAEPVPAEPTVRVLPYRTGRSTPIVGAEHVEDRGLLRGGPRSAAHHRGRAEDGAAGPRTRSIRSTRRSKPQLPQQPVIHADETKFRIGGENGWLWAFSSPQTVVYGIAPSRGQDVVEEFLHGAHGTIVHDGWVPYDIIQTAKHQLDLLHVNRWLEREEILHRLEPRPLLRDVPPKLVSVGRPPEEFLEFAGDTRWLLRHAIEWSERHTHASGRERREFYRSVRWLMTNHLRRGWSERAAARIVEQLDKRRGTLFTFLIEPVVAWHNNDAESQIRQGVLYRKISGGRRSWSGAWALERLLTVYRTCRKRALQFVKVLTDALSGLGFPEVGAPSG